MIQVYIIFYFLPLAVLLIKYHKPNSLLVSYPIAIKYDFRPYRVKKIIFFLKRRHMKLQTTQDIFLHNLADMYDAENQILDALETMQSQTSSNELSQALKEHQSQTEQQLSRLETIITKEDIDLENVSCKGIEGILKENNKSISEAQFDSLRDTVIALGALRVEHYEMAVYESLITAAKKLKLDDTLDALNTSLNEEEKAAKTVNAIAKNLLNQIEDSIVSSDDEEAEEEEDSLTA
jgi:ferritin-like metal-binding protein YciE